MFEQLEALEALSTCGTMGAAGAQLRISQSAVSKRIALLSQSCGAPLIERAGRRVALTPAGERLLQRVRPLLWELRAALVEDQREATGQISLGVSESILSSWGARAISKTTRALPNLQVRVHAHRSPALVERVRSSEYNLALCAGFARAPVDLSVEQVLLEPMVLIPSGLQDPSSLQKGALPVLTIEPSAETWRALRPRSARDRMKIEAVVESFTCAAQMAKAGLGHGLVPLGVARALGVPRSALARAGLARPISLIGRKSTLARSSMRAFLAVFRLNLTRAAKNLT